MANAEAAKLMQRAREMMDKAKKIEEADTLAVGRIARRHFENNFEGVTIETLCAEITAQLGA